MRKSLLVSAVLAVLAVLSGPASPGLAAGDSNMASCGNEGLAGFQPYLADCRAYEMVTPPFKDGFPVSLFAISDDGSHLIGESGGTFAGAQSNILSAFYEFTRIGTGWVTSPIGPPASRFPISRLLASSADLGRTLWVTRALPQSIYEEDLYERQPDGSFVKVGPTAPPIATGPSAGVSSELPSSFAYVAASGDLSHVLFAANRSTTPWPGDTTAEEGLGRPAAGSSLYEYVGLDNMQPALVGVSDGGTVVNSETLPAGRLISDCSTFLGSDSSYDVYNAMSADGKTVFFTARGHSQHECENPRAPKVSELYARIGGTQTVGVSEPSSSECQACNTTVRAPAEFQGASQDGSKVFFLTDQELFSGNTTMNLYEYDFDSPQGDKVVRVSIGSTAPEVQGVARVSQDGSHVYFVAKGVLVEGANAEGREPVSGGDNLYVFERDAAHAGGRVAFLGTLSEEDQEDWSAVDLRPVQATSDGRFLVFESMADLTSGDTSSKPQVFEYDALKEELVRVSIGQAGYPAGSTSADAHSSSVLIPRYEQALSPTATGRSLAVSEDGSEVLFTSAGALTPGGGMAAAAGAQSVYEYRSVGSIANGDVSLISDGRDAASSGGGKGATPVGLDASGGDVFFQTIDSLLASDVDTQRDVYDARVDGGFTAPAAPARCDGDTCQGEPSAQRSFGGPGSMSLQGGANLSPAQSGSATTPQVKSLTRAQKLARALTACKRKRGRKRTECKAQARRKYAGKANVNVKGAR